MRKMIGGRVRNLFEVVDVQPVDIDGVATYEVMRLGSFGSRVCLHLPAGPLAIGNAMIPGNPHNLG